MLRKAVMFFWVFCLLRALTVHCELNFNIVPVDPFISNNLELMGTTSYFYNHRNNLVGSDL